MGATLKQIAYYLTQQNREYTKLAEGCIAVDAALGNGDKLAITITLQENGEYLEIAAPQLLQGVKGKVNQSALFQAMLAISWKTRLLRWQYANGEVLGAIGFPLERTSQREILSEAQFNAALNGFVSLMNYIIPRLEAVLETGECLAEEEAEELPRLNLPEIFRPESLDIFKRGAA